MWDFYTGKNLFITGGSGFLGTALIYRLVTQAPAAHLYILCRGGLPYVDFVSTTLVPPSQRLIMRQQEANKNMERGPPTTSSGANDRSKVLDGDMLQPDFGLTSNNLDIIRRQVHVIIHSASSIALLSSLAKLVSPVIEVSERLAHFALECKNLECFVYVSTAYANGHLFSQTDMTSEIEVQEAIFPLSHSTVSSDKDDSLQQEWYQVRKTGSSTAFESHDFPWAYAYAKHLTERLITRLFDSSDKRLLVIRPSIIDPAQCFPYRNYCRPMSSPHVIASGAFCLVLSRTVCFSSQFRNPDQESTLDQVPVDVVVDRLLVHLASGTSGPVHTVAGAARMPFLHSWNSSFKYRRIPWSLRLKWVSDSRESKKIHEIGKLYRVIGMSFNFVEDKSTAIWNQLPRSERSKLHLFADKDMLFYGHKHIRREHVWTCIVHLTKRRKVTRWLAKLLYQSLQSAESPEGSESICPCVSQGSKGQC
ncbi:uncharacterized protein N7506_005255 [Penicillium brevicompactum]|uniref:uncharacterized protein n=1 Tax=Penicillium brevicompactum TaxID=5074 RepID=UPI0025403EBB|nr:uncharacterized protein N7506_005255 [Penicillium brevicompactum]KAJ5337233.1 hypothetical protein N7506_005255 [Penicillium brevicompactum]